jgi:nucleoside-diphosphate-sugar epimerase
MQGVRALVHCAYDFRPTKWREAHRINSAGSQKLFAAAQAAKIPRLVFISTMSAFPGCVSIYGRIKLEVEEFCLTRGVLCVRPGLLWSYQPGGMYQRLSQMAGRMPVLPLFGDGRQKLAFSHAEDLASGLETFCRGDEPPPAKAIVTAFPHLFVFREILETLARLQRKNPHFLPIPVWPVLSGLRLAELLHLPVPFKSDSLISLLNQDPNPVFSSRIPLREWPAA